MMPWRLAVALLGGIGLTSHWQCAAFSAGKACTDTEECTEVAIDDTAAEFRTTIF